MRRNRRRRTKPVGKKILFTLLLIIGLGIAGVGVILFETGKPRLSVDKEISFLGGQVEISLLAVDRMSGIKQVVVSLEQGTAIFQLYSKGFQRQAWFSQAGPEEIQETITIDAGTGGAKDGKAELVITVNDFSLYGFLKGNVATLRFPVTIDTLAPKIIIEHAQQYIAQGGSGIVIYHLSEPAQRHGVMIDSTFFRGYPLKGSDKRFITYIALPWNSSRPEITRVIAVDKAGNQGKAAFSMHMKKAKEKKDKINISDGFLNKKIPEFEQYYPEMQGTNIEKYLFVNNKVRTANAEEIAVISINSTPEQLWHDSFIRMKGDSRAGFADQRTYYYKGKAIDYQTHLGRDLADTARVALKAANRGRIVFAEYKGIYGNTVIIDHGQGVTSLYSHLSSISTSLDAMVEKDEVIGHSGTSGMAGGDHLHFSMLVQGIFVKPAEWWDQHWIDVNINNFINN